MNLRGLFLFAILVSAPAAFALEPQNPLSLCERFLEGPDRTACEKKMNSLKPDWYMATVCNSNFDDQLFYQCVELAKQGPFSPELLSECEGDQLNDNARINCVKNARTSPGKDFQNTKTSSPKKSPKTKK